MGCAESLLLPTGSVQLQQAGATLRWGAWASHCSGFSCCGLQTRRTGSAVVAPGLRVRAQQWWLPGSELWLPGSKCGLSSGGSRAQSCGSRALSVGSAAVPPGLWVRAQQLWLPGSECGLSSGASWALSAGSAVVVQGPSCPKACGFFLGPGIKPVSPALAGGFFLIEAPGKPLYLFF